MNTIWAFVTKNWILFAVFFLILLFIVWRAWVNDRKNEESLLLKHDIIILIVLILLFCSFLLDNCEGYESIGCSCEPEIRKKYKERYWAKQNLKQKEYLLKINRKTKEAEEQHKRLLAELTLQTKKWNANFEAAIIPNLTKLQHVVSKAKISQHKVFAAIRKQLEEQEQREKPIRELIDQWRRLSRDIQFFQTQTAKRLLAKSSPGLWEVFTAFYRNPKKLKQETRTLAIQIPEIKPVLKKLTLPDIKGKKKDGQRKISDAATQMLRRIIIKSRKLRTFLYIRLHEKHDAITRLEDFRKSIKAILTLSSRLNRPSKKTSGMKSARILMIVEGYHSVVLKRDFILCNEQIMRIADKAFSLPQGDPCKRSESKHIDESERITILMQNKEGRQSTKKNRLQKESASKKARKKRRGLKKQQKRPKHRKKKK